MTWWQNLLVFLAWVLPLPIGFLLGAFGRK